MAEGTVGSKSVVYLIQQPSVPRHGGKVIDITPLASIGTVRVLIERDQYPVTAPAEIYNQLRTRLAGFIPDRDYVAAAGGDYLGILMCGAVLASYGHEFFYYLRFDRLRLPGGGRDPSSGTYTPVLVPLAPGQAMRLSNG